MLQRKYFSCQNPFEFSSIKNSYEKVSLIQQFSAIKSSMLHFTIAWNEQIMFESNADNIFFSLDEGKGCL